MLHESAILERVIAPQDGALSPDLARHILTLDFPAPDRAKYQELAAKAQDGTLTPDEQAALDDYLHVNDFLTIIKAKARVSLRQHNPAA